MSCNGKEEFTIENGFISRTITVTNGLVRTSRIVNKVANKEITPTNDIEFKLRISKGTHVVGSDVELTSNDFVYKKVITNTSEKLGLRLRSDKHHLTVDVYYEQNADKSYIHKYLTITSDRDIAIERIDIEAIALEDIYQPYQMKQITAQAPSKWRPGLGQPLYTNKTATFLGVEFPAASNYVENNVGYCGYLWGRTVKANQTYTSYKAVIGVGDNSKYIQDTFFSYIDDIRIRPLRLQVQYNSWFDFGGGVTKEKFAESVKIVNNELCEKRNVQPFKAYVIDDGWQNARTDWSDKCWKVNSKFDDNFSTSFKNVKSAKSTLGLWLSPGCNFGGRPAVPLMREKGLEALGQYMSLAGPKYMQLLENRMVEFTEKGITYFKLDGLFGHLNTREYELNGNKYGIPYMPQLGTEKLSPSSKELNAHKYDELKTYYLVAGSERLMTIFEKMHKANPDVYIVISNGAYLSPWWLMYIDAVWMINAGDAAGGSNRTQELVYRDGVYYSTWQTEQTQFPINSVFNHEPKKCATGESEQTFREYLWMNLSRGTGFIELYIKTKKLSQKDWDVVADGLKWAHKAFPYFKNSRMHGGNPRKSEVYGYTGWNKTGGYASFHNPSDKKQTYKFTLNRSNGVKTDAAYSISSSLNNAKKLSGTTVKTNEIITVELNPGEVKVLEFSN